MTAGRAINPSLRSTLIVMNYRRLGSAGLKLSELSLGSWVTFKNQLAEETAFECMKAAYAAGA